MKTTMLLLAACFFITACSADQPAAPVTTAPPPKPELTIVSNKPFIIAAGYSIDADGDISSVNAKWETKDGNQDGKYTAVFGKIADMQGNYILVRNRSGGYIEKAFKLGSFSGDELNLDANTLESLTPGGSKLTERVQGYAFMSELGDDQQVEVDIDGEEKTIAALKAGPYSWDIATSATGALYGRINERGMLDRLNVKSARLFLDYFQKFKADELKQSLAPEDGKPQDGDEVRGWGYQYASRYAWIARAFRKLDPGSKQQVLGIVAPALATIAVESVSPANLRQYLLDLDWNRDIVTTMPEWEPIAAADPEARIPQYRDLNWSQIRWRLLWARQGQMTFEAMKREVSTRLGSRR